MITLVEPENHGEEILPSTALSRFLHLPEDFEVKVFAGIYIEETFIKTDVFVHFQVQTVYDDILSKQLSV